MSSIFTGIFPLNSEKRRLSFRRFGHRPRRLRFPGLPQCFSLGKYVDLSVVKTCEHLCTLDGVARRAACDQVPWRLLALASARDDEIHAHDEGVFESRSAVQTAILAAVIVAFQNLAAFFHGNRCVNQRKSRKAQWHGTPPKWESYGVGWTS